jgi:transcriptional regulator with XRE-family HTH domain
MTGPTLEYRPEDRQKYERLRSFINVSRRILHKRWELGLSQDTLGRAAGTKQSKISELEMMKGNPRLRTLDNIARELGLVIDLIPLEDSLKGSPFERPPAPQPSIPATMSRATADAPAPLVAAGNGLSTFGTVDDEPGRWLPLPDLGDSA